MAPVILEMDVHCLRCARKIRKAVRNMHGVEDVRVSVGTGLVVVKGSSLDASLLRWRIQSRTGRPVAVVSDGGAAEEPPAGQMLHLGPTPPLAGYSYSYPYGGYGGGWPAPALQYVPGGNVLPYDASQYGMMMTNDAPPCYRDDGPSGCCTMQ
ncbi:unnamed protein product [Miscanthus lutarioriparius]|uniref:HMA domain-containing protein n=1 Tax=Miscanthus lutarioriparius TaxID=422564 RepID=A0A811P7W1_9POAL|nr:unnamed protein product [Miscanthus lutarioriparius]